jgi:hypothetical protein
MYKGLLMVVLYLIQNTSGAKGPLSARKLGYGRTRHLRQEPFHDFVGVCLTLGSFYPKNIGSGQTSGSVRVIYFPSIFAAFWLSQSKWYAAESTDEHQFQGGVRKTCRCGFQHCLRGKHGMHICVYSTHGVFLKWVHPKIIHLNRIFQL